MCFSEDGHMKVDTQQEHYTMTAGTSQGTPKTLLNHFFTSFRRRVAPKTPRFWVLTLEHLGLILHWFKEEKFLHFLGNELSTQSFPSLLEQACFSE